MQPPKISVIMAVYNGERYLSQSVESILKQTERDFEFIIVNDGSTDRSLELLRQYEKNDSRIKIISRAENKRLIYSLNEGIKVAQGVYIARMDADDIAVTDRFKKQLAFMKDNSLAMCGTYADIVNEQGTIIGTLSYPPNTTVIKSFTLLHNPFIHSSVMMLHEVLTSAGIYSSFFKHTEDYELWTRIVYKNRTGNIPEKLMQYRIHGEQITKKYHTSMVFNGIVVRIFAIVRFLFSKT